MAEAGADIIVCHMGLTTGGSIGAETGAQARRLRAAHQGVVGGGAPGRQGHHRAVPRRADRHARGCDASSWPSAPNAMASTEPRAWSACRPSRRSSKPHVNSRRFGDRREDPMSGAQFGTFILGLVVVAIVVAIVVWLFNWLYLRSSKERAFVRTGLAGQKVVMNGGAFVLPIVHEVIPVNMNTLRLEVSRGRDKALITRDRMRVDVLSEFYVRVQASDDAIAAAAQTLGQRTMQPDALRELIEGKFVDALRTVAAEMTMEEMHEKRGEYVRRVRTRGRGRPAAERPRARDGVADPARPDGDGVFQSVQRLRRRGPDAAHRADRAAQEDPQRHRAGHDDRDPQQESRHRAAGAGDRPRAGACAAGPGAGPRDPARGPAGRDRPRARRQGPGRRAGADHVAPVDRAGAHRLGAGGRGAAHHPRSARSRSSRSRAARRSSWPSRSGRSPSPSSRGRSRWRRRRPTRRGRSR